jgi:hypothetical protein
MVYNHGDCGWGLTTLLLIPQTFLSDIFDLRLNFLQVFPSCEFQAAINHESLFDNGGIICHLYRVL